MELELHGGVRMAVELADEIAASGAERPVVNAAGVGSKVRL